MKIVLIVFISTLLSVSGIYILREKVFSVNDTAPEDNIKSNSKFYNLSAKDIDGNTVNFSDYKGKKVLIVNVASRCGFTNQYEDLQDIWSNYKEKDLVVVGIPTNNFRQEPGSNKEIKDFCETNFNINFPMSEKLDVVGKNAHPFYKWAKKNYGKGAIPKWNCYIR